MAGIYHDRNLFSLITYQFVVQLDDNSEYKFLPLAWIPNLNVEGHEGSADFQPIFHVLQRIVVCGECQPNYCILLMNDLQSLCAKLFVYSEYFCTVIELKALALTNIYTQMPTRGVYSSDGAITSCKRIGILSQAFCTCTLTLLARTRKFVYVFRVANRPRLALVDMLMTFHFLVQSDGRKEV